MIQLACWCRRHKRCEFDPWVGKIPRRRPRHPTAVFLPGEAHEQRALEGHSPQGRAELDVTDVTTHTLHRRKSKGAPENISHCFIDCTEALPLDHNRLREILKELGLSDHFTWLLRNLHAGQETTVRNRRGTTDWSKTGAGAHQDHILSPCLFNSYAEFTTRNAGMGESQAGPRFPGEISTTSGMPMKPL